MNQILCTDDFFEERKKREEAELKKTKKAKHSTGTWKMSLKRMEMKTFASIIIICCICLVFSYCIYACGIILNTDEGTEQLAVATESEKPEEEVKPEEKKEIVTTKQLIGLEKKEYTTSSGETYKISAILNIPSLGIKYPVLSENSEELMTISLNKYWGPEPNEEGNCCIVGHNYLNKTHFGKLPGIKIGDEVEITDATGRTLTYVVYETDIIDPEDTTCTSQLTNGRTEITLITCANGGATRFIAKCVAIEK